ncbi:MAG: hypothetical protein J5746_07450 [Victivallales bacterium]|nr:hypothetical protein [Victivallales bacterium]
MTNKLNDSDFSAKRSILLDFDGGLYEYRNAALEGELLAHIAPSGIALERRERLATALNNGNANAHFSLGEESATSVIHIGRTNAFDAYGRFLGLAEGIGKGNAFVLLDDNASDEQLLTVIRHEAGHILGTLDHGGAGLARYAWERRTIEYDEDLLEGYLQGKPRPNYIRRWVRDITYVWDKELDPIVYESVTLAYHNNGSNIEYGAWNFSNEGIVFDSYDEDIYHACKTASGIEIQGEYFYVYGCTAINCTLNNTSNSNSGVIYVGDSSDYDETIIYNDYWTYGSTDPDRYSRTYQYYEGKIIGCKSTGDISVAGYGTAINCEAETIYVRGDRLCMSEVGITPEEKQYTYSYVKGIAENCTANFWLQVSLGGIASNIVVQDGRARIGADMSGATEEELAEQDEQILLLGRAVVNDLTVEYGNVFVGYGGELNNATINGTLEASTGAILTGDITCESVWIHDVVPQTTIKVQLDLRDYAIANESEWHMNDTYDTGYITYYYANYTTRTVWYENNELVSVTYGTFSNKDGRFNMKDWEYTFQVNRLGSLDEMSMSSVVIDFGGTEKYFDSGELDFFVPASNTVDFNMTGDKSKWKRMSEDVFRYNGLRSLHGEAADILWLEYGEEAEYSITLAPVMNSASADYDIEAPYEEAQVKGASLTVKGENVDSGNVTVTAKDSQRNDLTCDLEVLVVPETLPVIGKKGTAAYASLLKKAQKEHLTTITAALPCDPELKLYGMAFKLSDLSASLTVNWTQPSITLKLQGKMEWTFRKDKTLTIDLADDNYFSVTHANKTTDWDIVGQITVPDFSIGKFGFSGVYLKVDKGNKAFGAGGEVSLPGVGISLKGDFSIVDGYIDSIGLGVGDLNVPLGATGLMLQSIYGSVSGIATSVDLTFGGSLELSYGPVLDIEWGLDWLGLEDGKYSLCMMEVGATISTSGEITGTATVDCLGGFISGSGEIKGSSGGPVSVTGSFSMLKEAITITGVMTSNVGAVTVSGEGRMQVPKSDYFGWLGGTGLSVTVFADLGEDNTPLDKRYILAWEEMTIFGNKFAVGIKCNFEGKVELLGSSDLLGGDNFGSKGPVKGLRGGTAPKGNGDMLPLTASDTCLISDYGVTLFQFNFTVSNAWASLVYNGNEYTQGEISNGQYENMQIVGELSSDSCLTIAVSNAELGEWTLNAYGDYGATFNVHSLTGVAPSPVISAVELGDEARSATINYSLADLSALENAVVSIFMDEGDSSEYSGQLIGRFAAAEATGTYEYAMCNEMNGGDYAFYVMVTSDNYAPVFSEFSEVLSFRDLDTEAPDQILRITAEWLSTGTTLTWEAPYDDTGVTGYQVNYRISVEEAWSVANVTAPTFVFNGVPNGTYTYRVAAYDAEGNLAAWSEEGSVFVNAVANASYSNEALAGEIVLNGNESAIQVDATAAILTTAADSLVVESTIGMASIGGLLETSTINGSATLLRDGMALDTTVNGKFTVYGNADGVTVADGGELTVDYGGFVAHVDVQSGGSLVLMSGAECDDIAVAYGAELIIPIGGIFCLEGDIFTAGPLSFNCYIDGNGHAIHYEQYKQTEELVYKNGIYRDETALLVDAGKFLGRSLDIIIDTATHGEFKIADKAENFQGGFRITDHATGASALLNDLEQVSSVGDARCSFFLDDYDGLWLKVQDLFWDYQGITIGSGGDFLYQFSLDGLLAQDVTVKQGGHFLGNSMGGMVDGLVVDGGEFKNSYLTVTNAVLNSGTYILDGGGSVKNITVNGSFLDLRDGTLDGAVIGKSGSVNLWKSTAYAPTLTGDIVIQGNLSLMDGHPGFETDAHFVFDLEGHKEKTWTNFISNADVLQGTPTYSVQLCENLVNWGSVNYSLVSFDNSRTLPEGFAVEVLSPGGMKMGVLRNDGDTIYSNGYACTLVDNTYSAILQISPSTEGSNVTAQTQNWYGPYGTFVIEYSTDNFQTVASVSVEKAFFLDAFIMPGDSFQWRAISQQGTVLTVDTLEGADDDSNTPRLVQSNADEVADVFFAKVRGVWDAGYIAHHHGNVGGWTGTDEVIDLGGRNCLCDFFEGSSDANVLLLTDDANGDALFIDDIYSALPGSIVEQQSRLAKINEIHAGAGDDVVDLTSQRFAYVGDGVTVRGGLGNDVIWANSGSNLLFGDAGNDRLVGAAGNDVLAGGAGNDTLHGGGGDDVFAFGGDWGQDRVEQLASGTVTLWFQKGNEGNWNDETLTYTDGDNSVTVSGVGRESITLRFGDEDARYGELLAAGAFSEATSERIFEDRGMLA